MKQGFQIDMNRVIQSKKRIVIIVGVTVKNQIIGVIVKKFIHGILVHVIVSVAKYVKLVRIQILKNFHAKNIFLANQS